MADPQENRRDLPKESLQIEDFSFSDGYDWLCYNFAPRSNDQTDELESLLDDALLHVFLGNDATDTELNTETYAVVSNNIKSVTAFALVPEADRKNHFSDVLEETNGLWQTAVVCAGYYDDSHGETVVFDQTRHNKIIELTHYYDGNTQYNGWDAAIAANDHFPRQVHFQLDAPHMHGKHWPHPGGLDNPYIDRPEDFYETGQELRDELTTEENAD